MLHWLLTNPYWLAAQGLIQNSTVVCWVGAGWGLAKMHARIGEHHHHMRQLLEEVHRKVHE